MEGARPSEPRYVLIAAPHTSNWDFPFMLLYAAAFDIKVTWMGKHSLFACPLGWFMRKMGGMPVYRHKNGNLVASMVETFGTVDNLALMVPTEGTRDRTEYWKSGFYHIAREANVPIVPSYLDFSQKRGGFGPALMVSADVVADMEYFRDFYQGMAGKFPANSGPIRLKEEDTAQEALVPLANGQSTPQRHTPCSASPP